jgi:hypothetical protein
VIVVDVLREKSEEMEAAENDAVIEAFAAQGSPKALDVWILPGRFGGGLERFDVHVFDTLDKGVSEDGVAVA